MEIVRALPAEAARVMMVGHNPGFERLADMLTHGAVHEMPTCSLAEIHLQVADWKEVEPALGGLGLFIDPKELD